MSVVTVVTRSSRVVFGAGSIASLGDEIDRLKCTRVLLVSTPGRKALADRAAVILASRVSGTFRGAAAHVPDDVVQAARDAATEAAADCIVSLGGSSSIGIAKLIALTSGTPIVAVPTTYGGSEMTPIYGFTRQGVKETARDSTVQPQVVIYDPELTLSLSPRTTASSGLNAMAHCLEALYAPDANPLSSAAALEGLRLLFSALPALAVAPGDLDDRTVALEGAWLAGFALGTVQMGLQHKLAHVLGGSFDLPHAETHAVLLPYTAAFNRSALPDILSDAPERIIGLAETSGAPLSLGEIGLREDDIPAAARMAVSKQYPNPRAVTHDLVIELLRAAWRGDREYIGG